MSKSLSIGIICYPSVGGSGIVATNLGLELAKLGHEIHFISYEAPFNLVSRHRGVFFHKVGINEYQLFKYPDYTLPLAETVVAVHQKYRLDILHVHYAVPHATSALLAKRIIISSGQQPPKVVTTLHGTDITLLAHDPNLFTVIKYSVERSDGVTAVSQNLKNDTAKVLKTKIPIEVIYNFYTPAKITKSRSIIRKGLNLPAGKAGIKDNDFLTVHLSNLRPVKRIPDLLKIAAKVKDRRFKLLILAGSDFSPYQQLAKTLNLKNKLIVKHNVHDVENYLNAADAGIYPSQTESFGMGILETMSYGKPVLATKAGGVPEVVADGITGFLFKVGDVAGFAKKIQELMNNPRLAAQMGQAAQTLACQKFCAKAIVPKYVEYYRDITKKSH